MGIVVVPTYGSDPATVNAANLDAKVSGLATEFNGNIEDANIKAAAAIAYSKLNLTGLVRDADIKSDAAINVTKLAVTSQAQGDILYASSATVFSRLGAGTAGQVLRTGGASANPSWSTSVGVAGSYKNLKVVYTNATTVTVTADELVLNDGVKISSVNEAINITTEGASGLMTGLTEAANTIYYIWIIRKSSDGTVNGILTVDPATIATLPSGYDQYALVSAVGNNNSSNFISFVQEGKYYTFSVGALMATGDATSNWTAVDLTPAQMTTNPGFVPSALSTIAHGTLWRETGKNAAISNISGDVELEVGAPGTNKIAGAITGANQSYWRLHVLTADTLYWTSDSATLTAVYLHGFEINKIG